MRTLSCGPTAESGFCGACLSIFYYSAILFMPQLDFFIIPQLTIFYFCFTTFLIFIFMFFVALGRWLSSSVKILLKVDLVRTSTLIKHYCTHFVFFYSDLLEQFIFVSGAVKIASVTIFILFFSFLFIVNSGVFTKCSEFVSSIIKDLNSDNAAAFGKNWINLSVIFIAVLLSNLIGILPYSFTLTSSLAAPFFFSLLVMILCVFNIIIKNKFSGLAGFLPAGTSIFIAPLIIVIEIVSSVAKFISLGIRLFANMFAGHLLLKVFYSIGFQIFLHISLFSFFSELLVILFVIFITSLEIMIAALQAFVMLLLTVLYIRESENFVTGH